MGVKIYPPDQSHILSNKNFSPRHEKSLFQLLATRGPRDCFTPMIAIAISLVCSSKHEYKAILLKILYAVDTELRVINLELSYMLLPGTRLTS